ncbi:MAG: protein kinase [Catenulispora sp.]|nr:protein kinase [Catenulispora sp.]
MSGADSREHAGGELIAERYQLRALLGRGAMGEVWSGRDLRLHRDVAVKLFHGGAGMSASDLPGWLRREGIAAAQIVHPNVAVLYDQGAHQDRIYLILELVPGTTLADLMQAGRLPVSTALGYAAQIAEALAAAHAARVVHRDIKPQNVLVTPDGTVKVVDFGLAGFIADTRSWTIARFDDTVKGAGTPEYSAPEQILGHNADARSDLYSLGTLLYTMLAGQLPYRAPDFLAVMRRKTTEDAPEVPPGAGVPREVTALVAELLTRDPDQRPRSAREVAARLRALLERTGSSQADSVPVQAGGAAERPVSAETGPASAEPWTAPPLEAEAGPKPAKLKAQVAPTAGLVDEDEPSERTERGEQPASGLPVVVKPLPWGPQAPDAPAQRAAAESRLPAPTSRAETAPPSDRQPDPVESKPRSADRQAAARPSADRPKQPSKSPNQSPNQSPSQRPKPPAKKPAPAPKPKPPTWGASKEHVAPPESSAWEPLAATGATVLSAVAEVEIRGRSLLPPPARSLLASPSAERYIPSSAAAPTPPPAPAPSRRGVLPILLIVLAVAAVAIAAIILTSR